MLIQRMMLGGAKRAGSWRIRVNTEASGTSNLTVSNYMYSDSGVNITTDWGDGTRTTQSALATHTYANPGDYVISHMSKGSDYSGIKIKAGEHSTITDVLDVLPSLPTMGDGFAKCFYKCPYLKSVPEGLFDNNADQITTLENAFSYITTGPLSVPGNLYKGMSKLTSISHLYDHSVLGSDIPDGWFEGNTVLTDVSYCFSNATLDKCGDNTFKDCTALSNINEAFSSASINSIGNATFKNCTAIVPTNSYFGTFSRIKCNSLGNETFANCTQLTSARDIFFYINIKRIGERTFANCTNINANYTMGIFYDSSFYEYESNLESLGDYTFENIQNMSMNGIITSDRLTTLPPHMFKGVRKFGINQASGVPPFRMPNLGACDLYLDTDDYHSDYGYNIFESDGVYGIPKMTDTTKRYVHYKKTKSTDADESYNDGYWIYVNDNGYLNE